MLGNEYLSWQNELIYFQRRKKEEKKEQQEKSKQDKSGII
jgi:hypothetical protein